MIKQFLISTILLVPYAQASDQNTIVKMQHLEKGEHAGTVTLQDTEYGLMITPNLKGLEPGVKGFHIHEHGDCSDKDGVQAGAAGGHYDPDGTNMHLGPYGDGHKGDLPPLFADENGIVNTPTLAPRLQLSEVKGRSLMIHEAGDNMADVPHKSGGGGGRAICGVIPK